MIMVGQQLGGWHVEELISVAGAHAFRAQHSQLDTAALLRVHPLSQATDEGQQREVGAMQALVHDAVPEILDFGVDHESGVIWTAYTWTDAEPLADRMLAGPVDWRDACAMLYDVARALSQVHNQGMVHRDIRPANVLVDRASSAWLVGFEFAMTQAQLEQLTHAPFGDLAYLAPEVLRDPTHHGAKADVYSFGCLLYEVLSGRAAFPAAAWGERADQATRMLEWKARAEPLDPGEDSPDWLRSLVTHCTEPDSDGRLPDLSSMVGWLEAAKGTWHRARARHTPEFALTNEGPPPMIHTVTPSLRHTAAADEFSETGSHTRRRIPIAVQYFSAGTLGCLTALGFTAIVILFVELQRGTF